MPGEKTVYKNDGEVYTQQVADLTELAKIWRLLNVW